MDITAATKVLELLQKYPALKTELEKFSPQVAQVLNNPLGAIMTAKMTIDDVSKKTGIPVEQIIEKVSSVIKSIGKK